MVVAIAAMSIATGACSGGGGNEPTADTASTTATGGTSVVESTTSDVQPQRSTLTTSGPTGTTAASASKTDKEIIERYLGYWNARFEANTGVPDPDDPTLREFATGEQLTAVIAETRANLDNGLAFERPADPHDIQRVEVIEVDGDKATVQECVVADGVVVRRDTGAVVDDEVATHNVQAEMLRVDGVWKVSTARLLQRFEGVAGCAHAS